MKVPQTFHELRDVFASTVEPRHIDAPQFGTRDVLATAVELLRICFQHNDQDARSFRRSCLALAGPNPERFNGSG